MQWEYWNSYCIKKKLNSYKVWPPQWSSFYSNENYLELQPDVAECQANSTTFIWAWSEAQRQGQDSILQQLFCALIKVCSFTRHQEGHITYVSFSAPFVLFLRCFCSLLAGGVCPIAGGFRFANIFLCLSISSRWEFILSCCLKRRD